MKIIVAILSGLVLLTGCSNKQESSGGATLGPGSSASGVASSTETQANEINACSLLSAADAQNVMGASMKLSAIKTQPYVCLYEEVTPKPGSLGPARFSLTAIQSKSADDENKAWAQMKETRHLQSGQKNVQVISGIGEEAYFTGNVEKGKVGVAAVVARKRKAHFALDSQVIEYRASPETMKELAKRIAGQLQ